MDDAATCPAHGWSFLDPEVNSDPYPLYDELRNEQPVFYDPEAKFFVVTRYEDVRRIFMDVETFSNEAYLESARSAHDVEHASAITRRFQKEGWLFVPNVGMLDDPRHRELRGIWNDAFRPSRVKHMESEIEQVTAELVDAFPADGPTEIVNALSIPLPLIVICSQVGARRDDIWKIKDWNAAMIDRVGLMQSEEEENRSIDLEIEAQHYFKAIIDSLRGNSDGTVVGELVNTKLAEGRYLTDEELISNLIHGIFLAGTETTMNSISAGMLLLCQQPTLFASMKIDSELIKPFIEEVLRVESPVQGMYRVAKKDTEMHGVKLPAGSVIQLRLGAANRDDRHFACPAEVDLSRRNAGAHLAFGSGIHHCVGAPLARRELYWAFKTIIDRFSGVRLSSQQQEVRYLPNYQFRSIRELYVEFER